MNARTCYSNTIRRPSEAQRILEKYLRAGGRLPVSVSRDGLELRQGISPEGGLFELTLLQDLLYTKQRRGREQYEQHNC